MAKRHGVLLRCPNCHSIGVRENGDMIEEPSHPDRVPNEPQYYGWYECQDCDHRWRYQDDKLNP